MFNNLHNGYFSLSLFFRSTLAMGQSNSMADSTVKIASTVYKSCSFLDKVCFDIPKELLTSLLFRSLFIKHTTVRKSWNFPANFWVITFHIWQNLMNQIWHKLVTLGMLSLHFFGKIVYSLHRHVLCSQNSPSPK